MGRKPIGKVKMNAAERQARRREKLKAERLPGPNIRAVDAWLAAGEAQDVAQWLADRIDPDRWTTLARLVRARHREG